MRPIKEFAPVLITGLFLSICTVSIPPSQTPRVEQAPDTATYEAATVGVVAPIVTATPTRSPTATPIIPDTGWQQVQPGLERRLIKIFDDDQTQVEQLYLLRIEPVYYRFDVAVDTYSPRHLETWLRDTQALIVVNGGYFRQEGEWLIPTGLTVVNGQSLGATYGPFAGMFVVTEQGPTLRWLQQTPYTSDEALQAALQSFPLLVKPGGVLGFPAQDEDGRQARRTVIGQDQAGRIIFLVTSERYFTLHQLSLYLTTSDLQLNIALNLDGGASSGLLFAGSMADPVEGISSEVLLPAVITVHSR